MMNESYEERTVVANRFPGYENRKQGRKEVLRISNHALNSVISIAHDLDTARVKSESQNKGFTVIDNRDLKGITTQLRTSCDHMLNNIEEAAHSSNLLDLTSTVYEESTIENMSKSILDDIYKTIGHTRRVKKDEQPVKQIS